MLLFLAGSVISHDILIAMNSKYVMRGEEKRDRTVGYLLYILCDTLPQRVANRARFYKSSSLVKVCACVALQEQPSRKGPSFDLSVGFAGGRSSFLCMQFSRGEGREAEVEAEAKAKAGVEGGGRRTCFGRGRGWGRSRGNGGKESAAQGLVERCEGRGMAT